MSSNHLEKDSRKAEDVEFKTDSLFFEYIRDPGASGFFTIFTSKKSQIALFSGRLQPLVSLIHSSSHDSKSGIWPTDSSIKSFIAAFLRPTGASNKSAVYLLTTEQLCFCAFARKITEFQTTFSGIFQSLHLLPRRGTVCQISTTFCTPY